MTTNDIKKGMMVMLKCGWKARIEDNKKGNIRRATVYGLFTEMGSVYAHDIAMVQVDGQWQDVETTAKQQKCKKMNDALFGSFKEIDIANIF